MQHDILVLGSINMDVVVKGPKFPEYGHTISCDSIHMIPGGKGANQAVTVARLGKKVLLIGAVGKDSRRGGGECLNHRGVRHLANELVSNLRRELDVCSRKSSHDDSFR